jgi:hypothetical protein
VFLRYWAVFNNKKEENLVEYLTFMDNLFYGLTWEEIKKLEHDFTEKNTLSKYFSKWSSRDK